MLVQTKEKKATSTKTAQNGTATAKAATAKKDQEATIKNILLPTAESRIKKLENLQRLADRHTNLTAKRDELDSFNLGVDNMHEKLEIRNGKETFTVSNSRVIEAVKKLMDEELNTLIDASDKEIVSFQI
jgi:hypothetical protein